MSEQTVVAVLSTNMSRVMLRRVDVVLHTVLFIAPIVQDVITITFIMTVVAAITINLFKVMRRSVGAEVMLVQVSVLPHKRKVDMYMCAVTADGEGGELSPILTTHHKVQ